MPHAINNSQLTPGTFVHVTGTVDFCRLTKLIEGEELIRENERRRARNNLPIDRPYTTITIRNPKVVPSGPNGAMTIEEQYVSESFYTTQSDPELRYSLNSKSPNPPKFYTVETKEDGTVDTGRIKEVIPTAELAQGLKIMLVLRIYKPKNFTQHGIALDSVIAQEPIRYYSGGAINHLAEMGLIVTPISEEEKAKAEAAAKAAATPAQAPVTAPAAGTNPLASAEQNPAPMTGMPAPQAAQSAEWICPKCGTKNTGKFCNECASPRPANPYAPPELMSQVQTGIKYDPNDSANRY